MDDRQLIHKIANNNDIAFGMLIRKYQKLVFNTAYKLVKNSSDAEDISQDVFLKVYKCIHQLKDEENISGWLFRITYNKTISFTRKKNPAKANSCLDIDCFAQQKSFSSQLVTNHTPAEKLEQKETAEELFKAIDSLPEMQKKVFLLHKFENLSYKEICNTLDMTKASVESLIYRAKSNLKKSLLLYFNNNFKKL